MHGSERDDAGSAMWRMDLEEQQFNSLAREGLFNSLARAVGVG